MTRSSRHSSATPGAGPPRRSSRRRSVADTGALPEHVRRNRAAWDEWAPEFVANGERNWRGLPRDGSGGRWGLPERAPPPPPEDLGGKDAIELGCGTAYVSAWLARRGARPVGIDNSEEQ